MLINNTHANNHFIHLKYTSQVVATLPRNVVDKPSACAGFFIMETYDLFNQPPIKPDKNSITQELVKSLFDYKEGFLYWKVNRGTHQCAGKICATIAYVSKRKEPRYIVRVNDKQYYAARIIFLWHKGYLPTLVDHEDGNQLNNKIDNLRAATYEQNAYNRKKQTKITASIYIGLVNHKHRGKSEWRAYLKCKDRVYASQYFDNEIEAALAYNKLAVRHHKDFAILDIIKTQHHGNA
jgi:hypothetical protein